MQAAKLFRLRREGRVQHHAQPISAMLWWFTGKGSRCAAGCKSALNTRQPSREPWLVVLAYAIVEVYDAAAEAAFVERFESSVPIVG